ncbi:MAG: hypothetical protein ACR2LL_09275 [Nitrosopumilus sp.]|uniref:hypothetical protein n=1 Tax=Nitrosopumilus sp. TaxID=2024843 RepID=UPI00292E67A3|nr:hypothetical protein [Nitrosopumilus sp.]
MVNYTKYLRCTECQKAGLYCTKHRVEVEMSLKKRAIMKVLQMRDDDHQSPRYRHVIKGLLESYNMWNTSL